MYRIAWRSKHTGYEGNGEYCFKTLEDVTREVECANNKRSQDVFHWFEKEPNEDQIQSISQAGLKRKIGYY